MQMLLLLLLLLVAAVRRLSAAEALSAGLVSRVVAAEQLLPEALKIGDKLARWRLGCTAVCGLQLFLYLSAAAF
jgi:enoyl-CoA hydratase/carnithine racemase